MTVPCKQCGLEVEEARRCYATPVCYACLPPPKPLPIALTAKQVEYLRACAEGGMSPYYDEMAALGELKQIGFVDQATNRIRFVTYIATDAGRAWLQQEGNNGRE